MTFRPVRAQDTSSSADVTLGAAMSPHGVMLVVREALGCHSERANCPTLAAANHQRRISLWHLISGVLTGQLPSRSAYGEEPLKPKGEILRCFGCVAEHSL
jgi:hypothetical protein